MESDRLPWSREAEESCLGAMLLSRTAIDDAAALATPADFHHPGHAAIFRAVSVLRERGISVDETTLREELRREGMLDRLGGVTYRHLEHAAPISGNAKAYARIVVELAAVRRLALTGEAITALALGPDAQVSVAETIDRARTMIEEADLPPLDQSPSLDVDEFLGAAPEESDIRFVIPGLIAAGDRQLFVAAPGVGKSTLLRMVSVLAAQGLHPMRLSRIEPVQVLLVELETPQHLVRSEIRNMTNVVRRDVGDDYDPRRLRIECREDGIDLRHRADAVWLEERIAASRPAILAIGPAYKLSAGDENEATEVRQILPVIDRLRRHYGIAVLLETHAPHESFRKGGRVRPAGSRLWLQWPEVVLGLHLDEKNMRYADLRHSRPPRSPRAWPGRLWRGGTYPWTLAEHPLPGADAF